MFHKDLAFLLVQVYRFFYFFIKSIREGKQIGKKKKFIKKNGFSLIECAIVLGILVILISFATIPTGRLQKAMVQAQIQLFCITCIYLQQLAIASGVEQELVLDKKNQTYSYCNEIQKLAHPILFGILPNIKGPPAFPSQIVHDPISFPHKKIFFYPDGIISAGTVYFVIPSSNQLYAVSCGVGAVSFLRKYCYDGKWHLW